MMPSSEGSEAPADRSRPSVPPGTERDGVTVPEAALRYWRMGLSIIPVWTDKRPLVRWREFKTRRATQAEVTAWYRQWPEAGVAIVCGLLSGVIVLDSDPRNGDGFVRLRPRLPQRTPTSESGGGGEHRFFAVPPWTQPKMPGLLPGLDLQGEASCVVAPPSVHPSGRRYRWQPGLAIGEVPLAPLPALIHDLIQLRRQPEAVRPASRRAALGGPLTLEAALKQLDGVRCVGEQWIARCPSHDDREPSLSLTAAVDGRLLAYCHAGCSFDDILRALTEGGPE